jgi:exoribonuclease R
MEFTMILTTKNYTTFSILDNGVEVKSFKGAREANQCLHGDLVKATETGCELVSHRKHPPLVGVIEFMNKVRYGFTARNVPLYLFKPADEAYPPLLVASKEPKLENKIALVTFEHWDPNTTFPRGGIVKILGSCGDKDAELGSLAYQYSPWSWTNKMLPEPLVEPSKKGRIVLTAPTINIDPEGCKDIDDVISLWLENEVWHLAISIADVDAWISVNPSLRFAEEIGQTLYQDGVPVRPLFPPALSEDLFSLLPGKERFVLSLICSWDGERLCDFQWKECILTNTASYSYESCYTAKEIRMTLLEQMADSMSPCASDSHKWIENFMILYNTEAAKLLCKASSGLFRVHSEPAKDRLQRMESLDLPAKQLAYPAATYSTELKGHWGLGVDAYCHASSPIRRYADCVNQGVCKRFLSNDIVAPPVAYTMICKQLNRSDKAAKAYERDLLLVTAIFENRDSLDGIVVLQENKVHVYVEAWRRILKVRSDAAWVPGSKVRVSFYANPSERSWKKRIVLRLDEI